MEPKLLQYIVGDLDPSEALLIEKKIKEDQDTLIEVESLRAVMAKMENLPDVAPPDELVANIQLQAEENNRAKMPSNVIPLTWFATTAKYAAAAAVLVFAYVGVEHTFFTSHDFAAPISSTQVSKVVEPWKDSKQVLTINTASNDNEIDSMAVKSSKLRPVDEPIEAQVRRDGVKLATQRSRTN